MGQFHKTIDSHRQGAQTMPRDRYTSPEIFAQEKEKLFARQWLCVGRSSTFLKPGDFQLRAVADESLIMVRDRGGELHAFFNVCRHRGTRLCRAASGHLSETIQCPYHPWTYTLEGRLIGANHCSNGGGSCAMFTKTNPSQSATAASCRGNCL